MKLIRVLLAVSILAVAAAACDPAGSVTSSSPTKAKPKTVVQPLGSSIFGSGG